MLTLDQILTLYQTLTLYQILTLSHFPPLHFLHLSPRSLLLHMFDEGRWTSGVYEIYLAAPLLMPAPSLSSPPFRPFPPRWKVRRPSG